MFNLYFQVQLWRPSWIFCFVEQISKTSAFYFKQIYQRIHCAKFHACSQKCSANHIPAVLERIHKKNKYCIYSFFNGKIMLYCFCIKSIPFSKFSFVCYVLNSKFSFDINSKNSPENSTSMALYILKYFLSLCIFVGPQTYDGDSVSKTSTYRS